MKLVEIINKNKFILVSFLLFTFFLVNLLDGERGLLSYYNNQEKFKELSKEKKSLTKHLILVEKKNNLLTENINLDYLEILYREKFLVGKQNEKIYVK